MTFYHHRRNNLHDLHDSNDNDDGNDREAASLEARRSRELSRATGTSTDSQCSTVTSSTGDVDGKRVHVETLPGHTSGEAAVTAAAAVTTTQSTTTVTEQQQETDNKPDLHRAVSYGAAAPYVAPNLNLGTGTVFRSSSLISTAAAGGVKRTASVGAGNNNNGNNEKERSGCVDVDVDVESHSDLPLSRVSTDAQGFTYPEGGVQAWLCVFGSFCGMMGALGMMNTIGTIQTYVSEHQLRGTNESTIGWIFSVYTFLAFFCGIQIGPVFDAFGPRWLVASGSVLVLATWFCLGLCTQYWHFIVVFGVCGGVGTSLVFTPAVTSIGHFFFRRRGLCTGIAAVGGSMGGVVYPLLLQALFPRLGFAWATRIIGFINIALMIFANLFIRARLPPRKVTKEAILPDLKIFRDPIFALTTLAVFFVEWALFIPLTYLTSYSIAHGVDTNLSYQIIAFMNVGSCFGRWLPGFIADKVGRFNTMIVTIALCLITTFAIWLPAGDSAAAIIVYAVVFGFASGSGISLTPVCVSQLCKVENYGRYYATCYTMVSFACLTGVPIAGSLITAAGGAYWGVIVFTGLAYSAAVASFIAARVLGVGWDLSKVY